MRDALTIGKIIIINGPSSSGKTTLALALQNALDKPYLILSLDEYSDLFTGCMAAYQKIGRSIFPRSYH